MYNPFRSESRKALHDKPGHFNPCSHCWRWHCHECLVFVLSDFAQVMRSDPKLAKDFGRHYNKVRGPDATRKDKRLADRNTQKNTKRLKKVKTKSA